jgi:hypothetical protein
MAEHLTLSRLCREVALDRGAVDSWISDGYLALSSSPRNGAARDLSRTDALRILTFSAARGCGISRDVARRLAAAIHDGRETEIGVTSLSMPARAVAGAVIGVPAFVTIDLAAIAAALDRVWTPAEAAPSPEHPR